MCDIVDEVWGKSSHVPSTLRVTSKGWVYPRIPTWEWKSAWDEMLPIFKEWLVARCELGHTQKQGNKGGDLLLYTSGFSEINIANWQLNNKLFTTAVKRSTWIELFYFTLVNTCSFVTVIYKLIFLSLTRHTPKVEFAQSLTSKEEAWIKLFKLLLKAPEPNPRGVAHTSYPSTGEVELGVVKVILLYLGSSRPV